MRGRRNLNVLAVGAVATMLVAAGCSPSGQPEEEGTATNWTFSPDVANTFNTGETESGGEVVIAATNKVASWNIATPEGSLRDIVSALDTIYPTMWIFEPDGSSLTLNEDLMTSAEVVGNDPTVVEYKINPAAVWDDGTPISSDDFEYMRNVSDSEICPDCKIYQRSGFEEVEKFEAAADKKSFTITFKRNFVDWQSLYSFRIFPAHIAAANGDLPESFNEFFANTMPTWSGGPYKLDSYREGVDLTLVPNPKWWGEPVNIQKITFKIISDEAQIPSALRNGEIDIATPQPQVDLPQTLEGLADAGVRYAMGEGMYFETFQLNLGHTILKDPEVRRAIFTALDREEMIAKTVGQIYPEAAPLGSIMVMSHQDGYENKTDALNFGLGDVEAAKKILEDAGYSWSGEALVEPSGSVAPNLTCVFTVGNQLRRDQCGFLATTAAELGISIDLESTDSLGETIGELNGYTYDFVAAAYLGSPFVASNSVRFTTGQSMNPYNNNPVVDEGVRRAVESTTAEDAIAAINEADAALVNDVWIMPLYQKPWVFAVNEDLANVRNNDTWAGLTYNVTEWGFRPAAAR